MDIVLEDKLVALKDKINQFWDEDNFRFPIYDGAINFERYSKCAIKIAWLLKEAYDGKDGTGGDWSYTKLDCDNVYEEYFKSQFSKATWHPIIYVTYGILNGFQSWEEMAYIREDPDMCQVVRDVAIINVSKLPAIQVTISNNAEVKKLYQQNKEILNEQLELLDPNVFIMGNTIDVYKELFGLVPEGRQQLDTCGYYINSNKLYIDAYHPSQRGTVKRADYVNDIIKAVKNWSAPFSNTN